MSARFPTPLTSPASSKAIKHWTARWLKHYPSPSFILSFSPPNKKTFPKHHSCSCLFFWHVVFTLFMETGIFLLCVLFLVLTLTRTFYPTICSFKIYVCICKCYFSVMSVYYMYLKTCASSPRLSVCDCLPCVWSVMCLHTQHYSVAHVVLFCI